MLGGRGGGRGMGRPRREDSSDVGRAWERFNGSGVVAGDTRRRCDLHRAGCAPPAQLAKGNGVAGVDDGYGDGACSPAADRRRARAFPGGRVPAFHSGRKAVRLGSGISTTATNIDCRWWQNPPPLIGSAGGGRGLSGGGCAREAATASPWGFVRRGSFFRFRRARHLTAKLSSLEHRLPDP